MADYFVHCDKCQKKNDWYVWRPKVKDNDSLITVADGQGIINNSPDVPECPKCHSKNVETMVLMG